MKKLLLVTLFMVAFFSSEAQNKCKITGTLTNRPPNSIIYLANAEHNSRLETIEIQAKDGKFEFEFEFDDTRKYELTFKEDVESRAFRPVPFFPKKGTISFELYSANEFKKNIIKGDPEQPNKDKFEKSVIVPFEAKMDSLKKIKQDNEKEFLAAQEEGKGLYQKMEQAVIRYISDNPSIFSYSMLVNKYLQSNTGQESIPFDNLFRSVYEKKYPNHIYTKLINMTIGSRALTVGGKYIDFEAPDLNSNMHKLSSLIDGKIAIIDLWASWCGPCRSFSIELIPIYEKYVNHGFTVVGVAREKDAKLMERTIAKDGYKWVNLLELNDRAGIWRKYGIGNAAGGVFMVNKDGTILAVSPSIEEIEKILVEKLGK